VAELLDVVFEPATLIPFECLEGKKVEGPALGVGQCLPESREIVDERLPARGRCGEHQVVTALDQTQRAGLVGVEVADLLLFEQESECLESRWQCGLELRGRSGQCFAMSEHFAEFSFALNRV
jgi:hypothetical protein